MNKIYKKAFFFILLFVPCLAIGQGISYICGDSTATLTINTIDSSHTTYYTWTSPLGVSHEGRTIEATEGIWSYYVIDSVGCVRAGNHTVVIVPEPIAVILGDTSCVNIEQVISAEGVPEGYTYEWDFGDDSVPSSSTSPAQSVSYTTIGTKTITLTITREFIGFSGGCSGTCTWEFGADFVIEECDLEIVATCNVP